MCFYYLVYILKLQYLLEVLTLVIQYFSYDYCLAYLKYLLSYNFEFELFFCYQSQ